MIKTTGGFKKGHIPWIKGKHHSKETRKKISEAHKGFKHTTKTKRKMSEAKKGQEVSEEHRKNLSKANKGNIPWIKGKHHSKETKKKMSEAKKGKHYPKLSEVQKGIKNHGWKGGITPENNTIRTSLKMMIWRKGCFVRDRYTCQKTGIKGGRLTSHHIKNFSKYPELRFATDNGITLSQESHEEFHKIYGIKNNTKKQIREFIDNN